MAQPTDGQIDEVLRLFHSRAKALEGDEFLQNLHLNIRAEQKDNGTAIFTGFDGPNRKTTESFLLRFRPFVLQNEQIHFLSVCKILSLRLKDDSQGLLNKVNSAKEA